MAYFIVESIARRLEAVAASALVAASLAFPAAAMAGNPLASVTPFASGLNNPRGLKFGPDGHLYVAEGGLGGDFSTVGQCEQVAPPVGPYTGSPTGGRISRINANGARETVVDNLPSSQTGPALGSLVSGVADVAFIHGKLYALLAGAGCSHGVPSLPNGVIRVDRDGSWKLLADLSAFLHANPVAHPAEDFEPDGTWYSMVAAEGALYAVEPNHGELDRISARGRVTRIADISASQGHIVPTAVAFHRGHFYVGNLNTFPIVEGSSKILEISMSGKVEVLRTGFTTILGLAFDRRGRLYVLENSVGQPAPAPGAGRVVRVARDGSLEIVAAGLTLPTAMTFGPDGNLYVSAVGFGPPLPGQGVILKLELGDDSHDGD